MDDLSMQKWNAPVISHAPIVYNIMSPYTQFLHPEYIFQNSPVVDSNFNMMPVSNPQITIQNQFVSQERKYQKQKGQPKITVNKSQKTSNSNVVEICEKDEKRKHSSRINQKSSELSNFKFKNKRNYPEYKVQSRASNKDESIKFESNIEFPSLPSVFEKRNSLSDLNHKSSLGFSYSEMLKSAPKEISKSIKNDQSLKLSNNNENMNSVKLKEQKIYSKSKYKDEKTKEKYESHNNLKDNFVVKVIPKDKENDFQYQNNQNLHKVQLDMKSENMNISSKKHGHQNINGERSAMKRNEKNHIQISINMKSSGNEKTMKTDDLLTKEFTDNVSDQPLKVEKNVKKRKRNKKKKNVDSGKVSLLSAEKFAAIKNKAEKPLNNNTNNNTFLICDDEFPDLNLCTSSQKSNDFSSKQKLDDNIKLKCCNSINIDNYKTVSDIKNKDLNLWNQATYSDILKMKNMTGNKNQQSQMNNEILEKNISNSEKELKLLNKMKKSSKKKKKSNLKTSTSKTKEVNEKPHNIELSICDMITSLQRVKLNQIKKKEFKTRVISTKRGIMDKMANPHNMLDSSSPMKKRGKEREKPCKKRLSAMRKIILREREKIKQQRENDKYRNEDKNISTGDENENELKIIQDVSTANFISNMDDVTLNETDEKLQVAKIILHTRKFREYCNHLLSEEIDSTVTLLLSDLIRFQNRLYEKDPIKARMKKRMVQGLREVTKHLRLGKLKCVIITPNVEKISSEGGLNDALHLIIQIAQEQNVPYVFALQRRTLGKLCMKVVPVSCVGIFNYDGSEEKFHHLLDLLAESREGYNELLRVIKEHITKDIEMQLLKPDASKFEIQAIRLAILNKISEKNILSKISKNVFGDNIKLE